MLSEPSPIEALEDGGEVHHPYTAFNQGYEAFDRGYPLSCNPYEDKLEWWWRYGWMMAKEHDEEDE